MMCLLTFKCDHCALYIYCWSYLLSKEQHINMHLIMSPSSFFSPVDDSAILDCQFSDFYHTAPHGFEKILFEQQIF